MARKRESALGAALGALVAIGLAGSFFGQGAAPTPQRQTTVKAGDTIQPQNTTDRPLAEPAEHNLTVERLVAPTYELQGLIAEYEQGLIEKGARARNLAALISDWTAARKAGRKIWRSEEWMKAPEYYAALDTVTLADDCFSWLHGSTRPIFGAEIGAYNRPEDGLAYLMVFHNGFAELLRREDMWKGILHQYDRWSSEIDGHADLQQICVTSWNLDNMKILYTMAPLREQVRGREEMFLAAQVKVLQRYKLILDNFDPQTAGRRTPGFFCEPCSVANVALLLAKQIDPQGYAEIEPAITGVRWSEEQRTKDLKDYIDLVLDSLKRISVKRATPE
jgi:hypothetical protein